jgi:hypothetical protein
MQILRNDQSLHFLKFPSCPSFGDVHKYLRGFNLFLSNIEQHSIFLKKELHLGFKDQLRVFKASHLDLDA